MSNETFRKLATAIVAAHQNGDSGVSGVMQYLKDRGIQLTPDQLTLLKQVVKRDIEPMLSQVREWTAPKREADGEPEGAPDAKRQKQDADNGIRLDNLPLEIIEAIAVQLGNVLDLANLRTASVGTAMGASRLYNKTVESLKRPFSVDNYVDYTDQDNLARLLQSKTTGEWNTQLINWTLRWMAPLSDNAFIDTAPSFISQLDLQLGPQVVARYLIEYSNPIYSLPKLCERIYSGENVDRRILVEYLKDLDSFLINASRIRNSDLAGTLGILRAIGWISQNNMSSQLQQALQSIETLITLIIVFYELKVANDLYWAQSGADDGVIVTLGEILSETDPSKFKRPWVGEIVFDRLHWVSQVMRRLLPTWPNRLENEEFLQSAKVMVFKKKSPFAFLLYQMAKQLDIYNDCVKDLPAAAMAWFAHCAATSHQQVDQCMLDPTIQFILNDSSQDVDDHTRSVMLACRSYVICTGNSFDWASMRANPTKLNRILINLFAQLAASIDTPVDRNNRWQVRKYDIRRKYLQMLKGDKSSNSIIV